MSRPLRTIWRSAVASHRVERSWGEFPPINQQSSFESHVFEETFNKRETLLQTAQPVFPVQSPACFAFIPSFAPFPKLFFPLVWRGLQLEKSGYFFQSYVIVKSCHFWHIELCFSSTDSLKTVPCPRSANKEKLRVPADNLDCKLLLNLPWQFVFKV